MTGRNGMSLKASYARRCKQHTDRCTYLSKVKLMPFPVLPLLGEEGQPILGIIMQDYKNIKADESWLSPVSG